MVVQAKDDLLRVLAGEIRDKDDDLEAATTRLEVRPKSARFRRCTASAKQLSPVLIALTSHNRECSY